MQMEDDDLVRRPDGRVIVGLTHSEWEQYLRTYDSVSEEELIHIRDTKAGPPLDRLKFEAFAQFLNAEKSRENKDGLPASHATSLFMLLSVHVKPRKRKYSSCLSVYGEITSASGSSSKDRDYIYKRELQDVEIFGSDSDGGYLTLNGPTKSCLPCDACFLLQSRQLSIRLYDQQGRHLYPLVDNDDDDDPIILDYSPHDFEHVQYKVVQNTEISLTLKYVSIPMAVYGRLDFSIFYTEDDTNLPKFVNVCGKVVAKYKNTFGNYNSEEIVLFDKNPDVDQYETVDLYEGNNLLSSSRCWVVAPAYSLLLLHIDLFDSQKKTILTRDIELGTHNSYRSWKDLVSDEYLISVGASWFLPYSQPPALDGSYNQFSWNFGWSPPTPPSSQPSSSSAIEVFSVLVCYEECTPLQIHGRLQSNFIWTRNFTETGIDIFKREEGNPLTLSGRGDTIPVVNGSRVIEEFISLSMICDLKDALGGLSIKGYEGFNVEDHHCERQSCSIFRGDHGFAALHYTIFSSAVQADLRVFVYQHKEGSQSAVSGSICAQYKYFDYSSQYKKNCYRIVLFKSSREDLVPIDADGAILLSRSSFVVPTYSSSMFDLDLMIGTQKFSGEIDVAIGTPTVSIKEEECEVKFVLEWSEVK